jgi:hypothetical protein
MDIVSFETAKRLKEAGFPQPTPAPGQFWHEGNEGGFFVIGRVYDDKMTGCYVESERTPQHLVFERATMNGKEIFATTATDILRQMPGVYLCANDANVWRAEWAGVSCYDNTPPIAVGENPEEVAAAAWLSLNAKTFEMKITGKLNDIE